MRKFLFSLALTTIAGALVAASVAPPARAQELSPGCADLNNPFFDDQYPEAGISGATFAAGDRVSATAGPPTFETPTTVTLFVDGVIVDTAAFPGTVEYVFPAAGTHDLLWRVDGGGGPDATWTVSCSAADPAEEIAELRGLVASFGLHHGLANALDSKLRAALAALEVGDTAGACGSLRAFLNQVRAQSGKKLTLAQAQQLSEEASGIRELLDCA